MSIVLRRNCAGLAPPLPYRYLDRNLHDCVALLFFVVWWSRASHMSPEAHAGAKQVLPDRNELGSAYQLVGARRLLANVGDE